MSWGIWITGVPGSGKSALAQAAAAALRARGEPVRVLELDEIRKVLTPRPRYTDAERDVVYRALGYMAALLVEAGVPVIIDATAHRRVWRDLARAAIPRFAEVQLVCPLEVCRERERRRAPGHHPRRIYEHAGRPGATVPGVDVPYEPALSPELLIDTAAESVPEAVARIVALALDLARDGHAGSEVAGRPLGWAIWITGRPGSGKSTVADRVAQALAARGVPIKVLGLAAMRSLLEGGGPPRQEDQEISHRALAYAAKLLTEVGVAVIVDATAPRRAWREAARQLIPRFAEIQLVCPPEVCAERERAARWGLGPSHPPHPSARGPVEPDVALYYEESLRPDLVLHTHIQDLWTMVERVLFLARRLDRMAALHSPEPERRATCEYES